MFIENAELRFLLLTKKIDYTTSAYKSKISAEIIFTK